MSFFIFGSEKKKDSSLEKRFCWCLWSLFGWLKTL